MRVYISKKHHQLMLMTLADRLGGSPGDALEHILNCWITGPPPNASTAPPALTTAPSDDPMAGLGEF
jgi:hypothetical protein